MQYYLIAIAALIACNDTAGTRQFRVTAYAGADPDPGALIVAHRANGDVLDTAVADALGEGMVTADLDAYVTTWLRWTPRYGSEGQPGPETRTYAVTTRVSDLVIYGPVPELPTIGTLEVSVDEPITADRYLISAGCAVASVTSLPVTVPLTQRCLGSDGRVDVLVRAIDPTDIYGYVGHAAGRVEITAGVARFAATTWSRTAPPIALQLVGVNPVVRLALVADGLELDDDVIHAAGADRTGSRWVGLEATSAIVRAYKFSEGTTGAYQGALVRSLDSVPEAIKISSSDFADWSPRAAIVSADDPPTMTWEAAAEGVDVVYHHAQLDAVGWNVIVDATVGEVTLPEIRAEDAPRPPFPAVRPSSSATRYFDVVGVDTFSSAVELGIHLERGGWSVERVVAPSHGDVRVSR